VPAARTYWGGRSAVRLAARLMSRFNAWSTSGPHMWGLTDKR
jgi:hypothetical protein